MQAAEAAAKVLKCGSVSDQDFNRGKALLKAVILANADSPSAALELLARQAAIAGDVTSIEDIVSLIDSISKSDVDSVSLPVIVLESLLIRYFFLRLPQKSPDPNFPLVL